jgi:hypothetical protein
MTDHEQQTAHPDEVDLQKSTHVVPEVEQASSNDNVYSLPEVVAAPATNEVKTENVNGPDLRGWRAEAGRKGGHRVHQLIQHGLLYEQEHGLKSGRQRLRQLIELGRVYEQEHGVQPERPKKRRERLDRVDREELLATLLDCLLRIAKPSFRAELEQLVGVLHAAEKGRVA